MSSIVPAAEDLFSRVAAILDEARGNVVRAVNTNMVMAHAELGLEPEAPSEQRYDSASVTERFRSPAVLDFLGLPNSAASNEGALEQAIIDNLQAFLLELGKGFAFVSRQKHLRFDDEDFYVDLVLYNFVLKCFVLVDLKIGKLTHADVGQMDGYVRLFEDRFKIPGDNPTVGLILCSDKNEAVAKYSVLSEGKQLFASKYLAYFPSEEELALEIQKERRLIEARRESSND